MRTGRRFDSQASRMGTCSRTTAAASRNPGTSARCTPNKSREAPS